jgi:hypothetical protein
MGKMRVVGFIGTEQDGSLLCFGRRNMFFLSLKYAVLINHSELNQYNFKITFLDGPLHKHYVVKGFWRHA